MHLAPYSSLENVFDYYEKHGAVSANDYHSIDGKCADKEDPITATLSSYTQLPFGNEDALKRAVAQVGPVSVLIDAGQVSFQLYNGGVYYDPSCSDVQSDHSVLVVGYGTYQGLDYWLVKNSWGPNWGDNGYIMMSRNRNNNCGIASYAVYPLT